MPGVRVVVFMTDGYIPNGFEIVDAVKKSAGTARVFALGIGNGVNRFPLDGMAQADRGEVEYVTLAYRLRRRMRSSSGRCGVLRIGLLKTARTAT